MNVSKDNIWSDTKLTVEPRINQITSIIKTEIGHSDSQNEKMYVSITAIEKYWFVFKARVKPNVE